MYYNLPTKKHEEPYLIYAAWPRPEPDLWTENVVLSHGDVPQGHEARAEFNLTNNFSEPLEITDVVRGCTCTKADLTLKKLGPGEKTCLQVVWKTGRLRGPNGVTIELVYKLANGSASSKRLRVDGNVLPDIATEPEKLVFSGDKAEVRTVRLMGGRMAKFTVGKAYCNHPAFRAELRPDNIVDLAFDGTTPVYANGLDPQLIIETDSPNEPNLILPVEILARRPNQ